MCFAGIKERRAAQRCALSPWRRWKEPSAGATERSTGRRSSGTPTTTQCLNHGPGRWVAQAISCDETIQFSFIWISLCICIKFTWFLKSQISIFIIIFTLKIVYYSLQPNISSCTCRLIGLKWAWCIAEGLLFFSNAESKCTLWLIFCAGGAKQMLKNSQSSGLYVVTVFPVMPHTKHSSPSMHSYHMFVFPGPLP